MLNNLISFSRSMIVLKNDVYIITCIVNHTAVQLKRHAKKIEHGNFT